MDLREYEQLQPHVQAEGITWLTPNQHCAWRVETLLTKEPDTIAWINGMREGEVLYDVGANMGQYSLLAAKRGVRVHAFEPESQNFALLCRNIAINKLGHLVTPWNIAMNDVSSFSPFHVQQLLAGNSCNSFGEAVNYHLQPKEYAFQQGCYGCRMDYFAGSSGIGLRPTHIKLDVDGFEHKVLKGASSDVLKHVKSVLVETNTHLQEHRDIEELMAKFRLFPDKATAEVARRKEGAFQGIGNVIYYKEKYVQDPDDPCKVCP